MDSFTPFDFSPSFDDEIFSPVKMAATVDVLAAAGVASHEALRGTGVRAEILHLPSTRISLDQLIQCYFTCCARSHHQFCGVQQIGHLANRTCAGAMTCRRP